MTNIYSLVDDYDFSVTGIIITDKSQEVVQHIVSKVKAKSDCLYDDIMEAFEENDIQFVNKNDIEEVIW